MDQSINYFNLILEVRITLCISIHMTNPGGQSAYTN